MKKPIFRPSGDQKGRSPSSVPGRGRATAVPRMTPNCVPWVAIIVREFIIVGELSMSAAGVRKIVYLGGLGEEIAGLSSHLRNRRKTGDVLRAASGVPVVELRASIRIQGWGARWRSAAPTR